MKTEGQTNTRPSIWCFSTYFAEGLPYMIIRILSSVYFTDLGVKERYIGFLNFLALPWNFKFLWAPFLDIYSTKRRWMIGLHLLLALCFIGVAIVNLFIPISGSVSPYLALVAGLFVVAAFMAATHDIAIDAYYIEALPNKDEQARFSGFRVMGYRISMVFVRFGLVSLVAAIGARLGKGDPYRPWVYGFAAAGGTMALLTIFHHLTLPKVETDQQARSAASVWSSFAEAFSSYLKQDKIALIIPFIMLYRIGDEILFSMVTPFLMRELLVTKAQYAWLSGLVGAIATIVGAMLGAWWIRKVGLKRSIWPITMIMNGSILVYLAMAIFKPLGTSWQGLCTIGAVHGYELIASGLGNSALLIFLLGTCQSEHKAAHYAFGSAIMTVFFTLFGGMAGRLVEIMGYKGLYTLAFFCSIPSMILLYFVPLKGYEKKA